MSCEFVRGMTVVDGDVVLVDVCEGSADATGPMLCFVSHDPTMSVGILVDVSVDVCV